MAYTDIRLHKNMYESDVPLTVQLEQMDPSIYYNGTQCEGLDAFQRQIKRFDIRCNGIYSDNVSKFFENPEVSVLFPEYVRRCILNGMADISSKIDKMVAIQRNMTDYGYIDNGLYIHKDDFDNPDHQFSIRSTVIDLNHHTKNINCSYEALKEAPISEFSKILNNLGLKLAYEEFKDMVNQLKCNITNSTFGKRYGIDSHISELQHSADPYQLNTLLYAYDIYDTAIYSSVLCESIDTYPANIDKGTAIIFDKHHTLEYIQGWPYLYVDVNKLINQNWEDCPVTVKSAFHVLNLDSLGLINFSE